MSIALVGGMDRLERRYLEEAARLDIDLRVFNRSEAGIKAKIKNKDALVIFTNKVSHRVKTEAMSVARSRDIPVFMYHSCGVCTLRECFNCIILKTSSCS